MKLYFYILESKQEFNAETREYGKVTFRIRCEECNVIENSKTYKPTDDFPEGIYSSYIRKENIGTLNTLIYSSPLLLQPQLSYLHT